MELIFLCVAIVLLTIHQALLYNRVCQLDKHIQMLSHTVFECVVEIEKNEQEIKSELGAFKYADTDSVYTVDLNKE